MKHATRLGRRLTLTIVGCGVLLGGIAVAAGTAVTLKGGDTAALSCAGASLSIHKPNKTSANASCVPSSTPTSTPPPPPSTTPPPTTTPPTFYAPGEALDATNTGYAAAGLTASQLTPSGPVTYSTAGQTYTGRAYSGEVDIEADNVTVQNCSLTNGGLNSIGFLLNGQNDTVKDCTITSPAGQSMYEPIWVFGDGNVVDGVNISRGENALTTYGTHVTIENSWLHDAALDSQPSDHPDSIEVYGGGPTTIEDNRIVEGCGPCMTGPGMFDSPINVAPWGEYKVQGLSVKGNFLDNGQSDILLDNQNTSCGGGTQPVGDCLINVVVEDNAFGGHQCPSSNPQCFYIYHPSLNYEGRPYVQTAAELAANPNAVLWPTTGTDVNKWEENADLTPDKDGQIVIPT